jgi:hypothetical protein
MQLTRGVVLVLLLALAIGQEAAEPSRASAVASTPATDATRSASLSEEQIRQLIRDSADKDLDNEKKQRDYTYVEREEVRRLNKGQVKSTEVKTYDVMVIAGEQVQKLVSKDDKPLSDKDARKEDEKIQKLIDKRSHESQDDREKRLKKQEKDREEGRRFVAEVADAYNFRFVGLESLDGRDNYVIDAEPKPGFQTHTKEARILPKFRFRAWIDKDESQWRKVDVQCIETVSSGLFLFRLHKGSRIIIEQTRVNDEVWLQRHVSVDADFRLALLKNFDLAVDITDRDYKKFRTDTKILPMQDTQQESPK